MSKYHPNTLEFLRLMDKIDYKKFNEFLVTVPERDIGQYVRRLAEEKDSNEGEYPSDLAVEILRELTEKYSKEREY